MRHAKHNQQLGVKTAHRAALLSNLAAALFTHGRIQTTLAKAKALRPFAEKVITLAKKARQCGDPQQALHFRRQALAKVRDKKAVHLLFNELADQFLNRNGGYVRIYKLVPRLGDAADMALVELIPAADEGYSKRRRKPVAKKEAAADTPEVAEEVVAEEDAETETAEPEASAAEEPATTGETPEKEGGEEEKKD